MSIDEPLATAKTIHSAVEARAATAEAAVAERDAEIVDLRAKLAACEAAGGGGEVEPPVVEPPTTPTGTKPPAILNDRFATLDMRRYHLDKTTTDQVKLVQPGKVSFAWAPKPSSLSGTDGKRAQMVIRSVYGGGGTAYRDPVGKVRWYGVIFNVDENFSLRDSWSGQKCIPFQFHQGNGTSSFEIINPPVSAEIMNPGADASPESILRLCLSLPALDPDRIYFPLGTVPREPTRFIFEIDWQPTNGLIRCWRDGVKLGWEHTGPTCHSMEKAQLGLAPFLCDYNPGASSTGPGSFSGVPSTWKRVLYHGAWLIGDETATLADMQAALA